MSDTTIRTTYTNNLVGDKSQNNFTDTRTEKQIPTNSLKVVCWDFCIQYKSSSFITAECLCSSIT